MAKASGGIRTSASTNGTQNKTDNGIIQFKRTVTIARNKIAKLVSDIASIGHPTDAKPFKIGTLPDSIAVVFEKNSGVHIINKDMYMSAASILHHRGGQKQARGKVVPLPEFVNVPENLSSMDIYEDKNVFVFTDYRNKFIIRVNEKIKIGKKKVACCHISSSTVASLDDFKNMKRIWIRAKKKKN